MNVALVSEHASPLATLGSVDAGGQNVYVAELARALAARGNAVTVYTRRDAAALPARVCMARNVEVVHVDAGPPVAIAKDALLPYMERFGAELTRAWQTAPPDVAHSHFWMSGVATRIAARRLGIPWAHTYHALGSEKRREQGAADTSPFSRIALEREILRDADVVIATSSAEVAEHRRTTGATHVERIPCGVVVEQFAGSAPERDARSARYRIATLSRLVPRKGVGDVVRALAAVPEAELVIAGGSDENGSGADPEVERLRALAEACGVAARVLFTGPLARADVPRFLKAADVVVCAPLYEPFGLVPLEAMACARPVVATRVGGLLDTVVDGLTGLHVPPGDPDAIAQALRTLLPDAGLRARFGRAGRRRASRGFSWHAIAARTESVYVASIAASGAERQTIA